MATQARNLKIIKRDPANFIGYTLSNSQWGPATCDPGSFFEEHKPFGLNSAGYGDCCSTTANACDPWTTCSSGTLQGSGFTSVCGPGSSCVSGIVATSHGAELDGDIFLDCGTTSNWIAYRTPPIAAASTTSTSPTSPKSNITPTSSPISPDISPTTNITAGASPGGSNLSGAAIAGAVVGPICTVALILGLAFLCLRQRRSKPPTAEVSSASRPLPSGPIVPFGDYTANKSELEAVNAPNSYYPVNILPAYPGTGNVETVVATNNMPFPTMSHGAEVATHSPVPFELQWRLMFSNRSKVSKYQLEDQLRWSLGRILPSEACHRDCRRIWEILFIMFERV